MSSTVVHRALLRGAALGLAFYLGEVLIYGRFFLAGVLTWGQSLRTCMHLAPWYAGAGAVLGLVAWATASVAARWHGGGPDERRIFLLTLAAGALVIVWIAPVRPLPLSAYLLVLAGAAALLGALCGPKGRPRLRPTLLTAAAAAMPLALILATLATSLPRQPAETRRMARFPTGARPANVVLIVLDTVRADHLSVYGYPRATTPALERIAREATVYERAISAAPWTVPAHASLFTGHLPAVHGSHQEHLALNGRLPTLASVLAEHGYRTGAIVNNPFLSHTLGFDRGFAEFRHNWSEMTVGRTFLAAGVRDKFFPERVDMGADASVRWVGSFLDTADHRPFFLFVNLIEAHAPYGTVPAHARGRFLPHPLPRGFSYSMMARIPVVLSGERTLTSEEQSNIRSLYDGAISYLDEQVGAIVDLLRGAGLLDETLLVITSDHGENLGDHGLIDHFFSLHDSVLHVPLIVRRPGQSVGVRIRAPVQTRALFATILEAAGIPSRPLGAIPPLPAAEPEGPANGQMAVSEQYRPWFIMRRLSLFADRRELAAHDYRMRAVQDARWKLLWREDRPLALYDLAADPHEERNLATAHPDIVQRLLGDLRVAIPDEPALAGNEPPPFDWLTFRSLRALGYVR